MMVPCRTISILHIVVDFVASEGSSIVHIELKKSLMEKVVVPPVPEAQL